MSHEPDFELSADMRLIELQRSALGLSAPMRPSWESRLSSIDGLGVEEAPVPSVQSAVITVDVTANPSTDVIPGAIVTLALSIANEGAASSPGILASVPLPGGASY